MAQADDRVVGAVAVNKHMNVRFHQPVRPDAGCSRTGTSPQRRATRTLAAARSVRTDTARRVKT